MPATQLLQRPGRPVEEWQFTTAKIRREHAALDQRARDFPQVLKLRPLPRLPKRELLLFPERLSRRFYLQPWPFLCRFVCPPRYRVRKNQKNLTTTEWARFVNAIEALARSGVPSPTYQDFVEIHRRSMETMAGMAWGAHTMSGHDGRNFLTWHREYLVKLETALVSMNPLVTIPYWDWVNDRAIPSQLANPADIAGWGITRGTFNASWLPTGSQINSVLASPDFASFSGALEGPHGWVHGAIAGTMGTSTSPADPLFWLHHGFIDKLWADWQVSHPSPAGDPANLSETFQPPPIMTRTVAQVQRTHDLGYVYA